MTSSNKLRVEAQSKHSSLNILDIVDKEFNISNNSYFPTCEVITSREMVIVDDINKLSNFPAAKVFKEKGIEITSIVALPIRLKSRERCHGVLTLHFNKILKFNKDELELFESISEMVAFGIEAFKDRQEKEKLLDRLNLIATTDTLTGCMNRYKGNSVGNTEIERAHRYERAFSLLYFDIDHFKEINDTYGHEEGDKVLRAIVKETKNVLRASDTLIRWGGEEFVVILPESELKSAIGSAQKLSMAFENMEHSINKKVTASFGVVKLQKDERWDELIKRADDFMYKAKQSGRNRVVYE